MAFIDTRFPDTVSRGATGGPEFATSVIETGGGYEKRNSWWSVPRGKWNVATGLMRRDDTTRGDFEALIAFFRAIAQGRANTFPFKDWSDYVATDQNIGAANGATTVFQLRKGYTSGSTTVWRTITKPVTASVSLKVGGITVSPSAYSVARLTGAVTFVSAPASGAVTWSGQFDVPARFDTDKLDLTLESLDLGQWSDIPVVEVRE